MIKLFIKLFIPEIIIRYKNLLIQKKMNKKFEKLSTKQVFKEIYDNKIWTPENDKKKHNYYSGFGSHKKSLTNNYIKAVNKFLTSFKLKPTIVELGCGDFKVSSLIVNKVKKFIAFDIHENLIKHNKKYYKKLKNVDFKVLDFTKNKPPSADICIVRCVLQHLSNKMIKNFLKNINNKFKYLIITEHCPSLKNYKANKDIISGPGIRLYKNSGVDLSKTPFNLKFFEKKIIYKTNSKLISGHLITTLYKLK